MTKIIGELLQGKSLACLPSVLFGHITGEYPLRVYFSIWDISLGKCWQVIKGRYEI